MPGSFANGCPVAILLRAVFLELGRARAGEARDAHSEPCDLHERGGTARERRARPATVQL
jgi:hypothetical protein